MGKTDKIILILLLSGVLTYGSYLAYKALSAKPSTVPPLPLPAVPSVAAIKPVPAQVVISHPVAIVTPVIGDVHTAPVVLDAPVIPQLLPVMDSATVVDTAPLYVPPVVPVVPVVPVIPVPPVLVPIYNSIMQLPDGKYYAVNLPAPYNSYPLRYFGAPSVDITGPLVTTNAAGAPLNMWLAFYPSKPGVIFLQPQIPAATPGNVTSNYNSSLLYIQSAPGYKFIIDQYGAVASGSF
jgi:hypothetical protein